MFHMLPQEQVYSVFLVLKNLADAGCSSNADANTPAGVVHSPPWEQSIKLTFTGDQRTKKPSTKH